MRAILTPLLILLFLLSLNPLQAYNYSWSTHEDITDPNTPPDDKPPEPCTNPCGCADGGSSAGAGASGGGSGGSSASGQPGDSKGSPVYLETGHFTWNDIDLVLSGKPAIKLNRNFSSHESRVGLFGNGWISNFERAVVKTVKGDVVDGNTSYSYVYVNRHDNSKRYYYTENNGTIEPILGGYNRVTRVNATTLQLTYPDGVIEQFVDGNLILRRDTNGNSIHLLYDNLGLLQEVKDDNSKSLTFYYNAQGFVSEVDDYTGRVWNYSYDTDGNLVSVTNPLGDSRTYTYQTYKPLYDAQVYSQLTSITDASGRVVTAVTYSNDKVASYTSGANKYTYSYSGNTVTKVDSSNDTITYTLAGTGFIQSVTDPLGHTNSISYDANDTPISNTDALGNSTTRTYDALGRTLSSTSPLGETTYYEYIANNPKPTKIRSALGHTTTYTYDDNYNLIGITDAKGNTRVATLDAQGNPVSITDAKGNKLSITYNDLSKPLSITDALGRTTTFTYDSLGNAVTMTNAKGDTTTIEYDQLSRVIKTTNALGHTVLYTYDAVGRILSLTDPVGNITTYSYDTYGRLNKEVRPDSKSTTYSYTSDNLVSSITRYDGKVVSFTYDKANRLLSESVDGDTISLSYNAKGLITTISNAVSTLSYTYDAASRLISTSQNGTNITYAYDAENELSSYSFLGNTVNYTRDALGLATSINNGINNFGFAYDANGVQSSSTLGNGITEDLTFNAAYELTRISSQTDDSSYTYDKIGLLTSKTLNATTTSYTNDAIARLTQDASQTYSYDKAGNNQNNSASYETTTNQLMSTATHSFTYDDYGNLNTKVNLQDNSKTLYTWNSRNQLIKVVKQDDTNTTVKTLEFTYDALGRRASKTVNAITQNYLYDGQDIIAILDSNNNPISIITHDESVDTPLSIRTSNESYFYQRDHQGSITNLTDSNQNKIQEYTYTDAYGTTQVTQTLNTNNPYAYTGRELDDTDLYYYRARYYDPTTQRFLSEDPIGFSSGDFNFYRYVYNSPTYYTDHTGESAVALALPVAGGMAAADGPFPFGDALGLGLLGGALAYDWWNTAGAYCASSSGDKEHTKNKRKSTEQKHQKGQKRKDQKYNDKKRDPKKGWKSRK